MTYLSAYKTGNLVLPTELLFHFHEIFDNSDDFLVWQFFYLQNTTSLEEISPVQIAESIGKSVAEVNRSMSNLTEKGLLQYKTIALNGEIEAVFDALPATRPVLNLLLLLFVKLFLMERQTGNTSKLFYGIGAVKALQQ